MTWMIIAALLPALVLGLYIYFRDQVKEPFSWLLRTFIAGICICVPVAFVEAGISHLIFGDGSPATLFGTTVQAFFVAAVPEEAAKLLVLWLILRRNPYFDEHFDGIVYAVCVGLGFAAIENVAYVMQAGEGWITVAAMRALLAVPGHYAFAIIMGYYYSIYHFVARTPKNAAKMLLLPVMAHGVYDAIAMSGSVDPIAGGISFFVLIFFCIKLQKAAQKRVQELVNKQ